MGTRSNRLIFEAVLTCTHNICFEQKDENSQQFELKIVIFTVVKNRCILHGRVFVMIVRITDRPDMTSTVYC